MDLQDKYDELDSIVRTLDNLIDSITDKDYILQLAVGRALGMAGFGIDTSVASAEEVQNAIEQQEDLKLINETNLKVLQSLIKNLPDAKEFYNSIIAKYHIADLKELNKKQYGEILIEIKKIKGE